VYTGILAWASRFCVECQVDARTTTPKPPHCYNRVAGPGFSAIPESGRIVGRAPHKSNLWERARDCRSHTQFSGSGQSNACQQLDTELVLAVFDDNNDCSESKLKRNTEAVSQTSTKPPCYQGLNLGDLESWEHSLR
jgi:hypothetical protein